MDKLYLYIKESQEAFSYLTRQFNLEWNELDFQIELSKTLGIEESDHGKLLDKQLLSNEMIAKLSKINFSKYREIRQIIFNTSILPKGIIGRLDEQRIKVKGEIWQINIYDPDPFPSNPHAHNLQTGHKLHLGDGSLYTSKNKPLNKTIKRKHLLAIREKCGNNIDLPVLVNE